MQLVLLRTCYDFNKSFVIIQLILKLHYVHKSNCNDAMEIVRYILSY